MRSILVKILLWAFCLSSCAQEKPGGVELNWKIDPDEKITYQTKFENIEMPEEDKIGRSLQRLTHLTTLTNKQKGVVDIIVKADVEKELLNSTLDKQTREFLELMQQTNKGVVLHGSVNNTGRLHSLELPNDQKNLIVMLFGLPEGTIQEGDTWEPEVRLIENGQNFVSDSSYKKHVVKLTEIKEVNNKRIAIIKYNLVEYENGSFNLGSKKSFSSIKITYEAEGTFLINKGRWDSYEGIMTLESSGFKSTKTKTKLSLKED